jgi:hypothetical protein
MPLATEKYAICAVRPMAGAVFGEAYAVVTATRISPKEWLAAYFLLTQWPVEALHQGSVVVRAGAWPAAQRAAALEHVLDAARHQVELAVQGLVQARAHGLGRPDLAQRAHHLKPCASPFVGCWMLGRFTQQMVAMQAATPCVSLARYLGSLQQVSVFQFADPPQKATASLSAVSRSQCPGPGHS